MHHITLSSSFTLEWTQIMQADLKCLKFVSLNCLTKQEIIIIMYLKWTVLILWFCITFEWQFTIWTKGLLNFAWSNTFITGTVEPRYNEVLGAIKITLLYQVSHYIRVKKQRNIKSLDQQNYLVIRGFCYIRPLYNEVPLYM